jgi:hypothetical protein
MTIAATAIVILGGLGAAAGLTIAGHAGPPAAAGGPGILGGLLGQATASTSPAGPGPGPSPGPEASASVTIDSGATTGSGGGVDTGTGAGQGTSTPDPTATTPATQPPDQVPMAPGAAASTAGPQIAAFLWQYFDAINRHDYTAYSALLGPQMQGMSQGQFDSGYGSTTDSAAMLQAVSDDPSGDYVAEVTFTSNQDPSQSITGTSCTNWDISLYLTPGGGSFLIDKPPASYHASYTAC